jgi:signal transduction histidine kinase
MSRYSAESHGHQLIAETPDSPLNVVADRAALRRVLSGLIENAIKYTPSSGRITISARGDGEYAKITVTDTGRGISKKDLPHIFEKFYRGRFDPQTSGEPAGVMETSEYPGVGLGLYLAQIIIGQMGGHITVESERGEGARFSIHIPKSDERDQNIV